MGSDSRNRNAGGRSGRPLAVPGMEAAHEPPRPRREPGLVTGWTQIAFYSERVGNAEIYVMNADGLQERRVTRDPWYDQAVRWEPVQ
jgi:hypothetical protein